MRALSVLVIDPNNFARGLVTEIMRYLNIPKITAVSEEQACLSLLYERTIDVILAAWEDDDFDTLAFTRKLRRLPEDRLRRLPIIFVTSGLARAKVIAGRDAGVDEFLTKPISPAALQQRLGMVIETPRPFVDSNVYLGPCRRRKNPADYYGEKRRRGERAQRPKTVVDAAEEEAKSPIRVALAALGQACQQMRASSPELVKAAFVQLSVAKQLAVAEKDNALHSALAAFEAYLGVATPMGQLDQNVILIAISTLEQLSALPLGYVEARDSVAIALSKAIQKKLAA